METLKMNVKELVRATALQSGKTQKEISEVLYEVDSVIKKQLAVCDPNTNIEIKLLPSGVSIMGIYQEAHIGRNPRTGNADVEVPAQIKVRGKIYPAFKVQVNSIEED